MSVHVNPEGLMGAGSQLAGSVRSFVPAVAMAPGSDPTSAGAADQLNGASQVLSLLLNHSSTLREIGAAALMSTAITFTALEEANRALVLNGGAGSGPIAPMSVPHVPSPSVPTIPALPSAPSPMPGEMYSQTLYNGPGSSAVHEFAQQWASHGQQLTELADSLTRTAQAIDEHWVDGSQQAGANVLRHAQWVAEMAQHAHNLASNARTLGDGYDQAKAATPSPQEFAETRQQLQQARQRFAATHGADTADLQQLIQRYATQQTQATEAAIGYHGRASADAFSARGAKTAPAIVGQGGPLPRNGPGDIWDPSTAYKLFNSMNECEVWITFRRVLYPWQRWECHLAGPGGVAGSFIVDQA